MLEVRNLYAKYGRAEILSDVTFEVGAGEVGALLGRNGAGKTTTFRSIMQLLRPSAGDVTFAGESLVGLRPYEISRRGPIRLKVRPATTTPTQPMENSTWLKGWKINANATTQAAIIEYSSLRA